MTKKLFSVRDAKAEIYDPPMAFLTHAEAERAFERWSNDSKTKIGSFPEDFDLYYLGSFDDASGKLETLQTPQHMVKAINTLRSTANASDAAKQMSLAPQQ